MNRMRRRGSFKGPSARVADAGSESSKKKKPNVMEIDGALWALDEHGNPLKRLRKKNKDAGSVEKGGSVGKKKKNITEIDGQPWLLDEHGTPIKKLRKKAKDGDNSSDERESRRRAQSRGRSVGRRRGDDSDDGGSSRGSNRRNGRVRGREEITRRGRSKSRGASARHHSDSESSSSDRRGKVTEGSLEQLMDSSSQRRKKKKKVVEIDGQLWACDENGNPVKKVRRKGGDSDWDQRGRSQSRGPARDARSRSRPAAPDTHGAIRRNESFTDEKGRRHVFDEHGIESVFDKNGKKLRKKGQPKSPQPEAAPVSRSPTSEEAAPKKDLFNRSSREIEFGIFDHLWDDTSVPGSQRFSLGESNRFSMDSQKASSKSVLSPTMPTRSSLDSIKENGGDPAAISQQMSEIDKQNRKLQMELEKAKQEMKTMADQARKEKAKNIKAMSDMMQLKAEYHDANSELLQLRNKVNDLSAQIEEKETALEKAKEENTRNPTREGEQAISELEAEKDNLESKLQLEKATAQQEIKKKEEQLAHMNRELSVLRNELEMLITGKKGNMEVDPIMVRLLKEKKEFEEKYNQEREVNTIKISSLQEMIETLETMNQDLNKQMLMTKKGNRNTGLSSSSHGPPSAPKNRTHDFERRPPEPSKSFDGGVFGMAPGAIQAGRTWFNRRGSILGGGGGEGGRRGSILGGGMGMGES
eukprot:scaffold1376_cov125-Cylindrotheca_fusiformis.AAC.9